MGPFRLGAQPAAPAVSAVLESFGAWIARARPEFQWTANHFTHPRGIFPALDAITRGEVRRLILSIAVRHAKTESITAYLAYRLVLNPKLRLLIGSYSQQQADKVSRNVRNLARRMGVDISKDRDASREWETVAGGAMQAVGAGSGVASVNADIIAIDDPIGSRDEAESPVKRDRVFDWLTNDILARCVPSTAVIVSHPRWHQDDPIGRLRDQQAGRWTDIDLPGRAEPNDPLGRIEGAPLWPEERGEEWLEEKLVELSAYGFASLVQGRPRPRAGGMFKWADWLLLDTAPATGGVVRFWDTAGTEAGKANDPDWTVGVALCRLPDLRTAVLDVARFRHAVSARDAAIAATAKADAQRFGGRIRWRFEKEAGVGGADRTAHLKRIAQAANIPCDDTPATGNKVTRAEPFASAVGAGNVLLCPGEWRDALRAEAADFPTGKHDDQVDACAGAFNMLAVPSDWHQTRVTF